MSKDTAHTTCLRKIDEMRHDLDTIEASIRKDMEIADINIRNDIDSTQREVKSHKNIFIAIGSTVLLAVLYAMLDKIGL